MEHERRGTARAIGHALKWVAPLVYRRRAEIEPLRLWLLDGPLAGIEEADGDGGVPVPAGSYWGGSNVDFVLRGAFVVPPDFDPAAPVALHLPLGEAGDFSHPEALALVDGVAWAGVDRHHQELPLPDAVRDGRPHALTLHGWTGLLGHHSADPARRLFMGRCAVVQIDRPTRQFVALARTALQAAELLDAQHPARDRLLNALDAAFGRLDSREPFGDAFYAGVPAALAALQEGLRAAGPPLDVDLIAAGHAHIDVAWLWTLGHTRGKTARTFATALRLMEQFPAFHFTQSQPQLYDFVRRDRPELFAQIAARVAEGRWEPIGGMWVEADCNISGPESLVRQLLLGRAFFRDQFGAAAESPVLWLPDVFGYAWNLPQLIRGAGLEYFFTIKIGWNSTNPMPYDSFWWQGLDGTRVLTHFSTTPEAPWHERQPPNLLATATYNANLSAFAALGSWARLKHKATQRTMLMSYGYGDGGGGPTREMNENAAVLGDFPGLPRVTQGRVIDFFRRLEAESGDRLPVWNAELYLELHRGTYTTQGRNKRANRRTEFLLHDAEFLGAWAALLDVDYSYPREAMGRAWELVCLNQFHDIIPGSSIGAVYEESQRQYAEVAALGEAARDAALAVVARAAGGDLVLVNPTGFARDDYAFCPGQLPPGMALVRPDGAPVMPQAVEGGVLLDVGTLLPCGALPLRVTSDERRVTSQADDLNSSLVARHSSLENDYLQVEFNPSGDISRIFDKTHGREVLPPGTVANQWQAFEDRPVQWDAWDIDATYEDRPYPLEPVTSVRVVERGPLRATLEFERHVLGSRVVQRVSLCANRPQIDFDTWIDWRERHTLLKVAFPVDVLAPEATYEIQWGNVRRPTHRNTSWDWARFETCAQKWVDLSEGDYGAALLNDGKYGHDIRDNVIRLTLLRAPTEPDPTADQGEHRFAYSFRPHGPFAPSAVAAAAYALNNPILVATRAGAGEHGGGGAGEKRTGGEWRVAGGGGSAGETEVTPAPLLPRSPAPVPLITVNERNVIVETIKPAEDGDGLIVRLYECERRRGPAALRVGFPLRAAWRTNLLEENEAALVVDDGAVQLDVRPFQVITLRLCPIRRRRTAVWPSKPPKPASASTACPAPNSAANPSPTEY